MFVRARRAPLGWLLLAAVSYGPLLATRPGLVAADTKAYLYLDPSRLLSGAASMWNPDVGMGTVTHQNIGYLWPMGPWFWAVHQLGIPTWVGQRLWMGTLLLAAGLGVRFCARRLGLSESGAVVAGLGYALSPYIVDYIGRTSAILLPWAGLGWLVGLTVLAARRGGWRHPALMALVVLTVGGVNATSVLLAAIPPGLWLVYAAATGEVTWRRSVAVALRVGALSAVVSAWWVAGLYVEAAHGLDILRTTETVPTVARTSSAAEVLRGLGYWYFYGQDKVQPWTEAGVAYTQALWLVLVSFAVPALSLLLGSLVRWRYRAYAVALVLGGVVVAVGVYPYGHSSALGAVLGSGSGSSIGLALRSGDREVPGVVLGLMLLLGAGVTALRIRWRRAGLAVAAVAVALVAADLPPLWQGRLVAPNLAAPASVPGYWRQGAAYLNGESGQSRVLGLPGEDFAAYGWGVTQDQVAPGLLDRPYVDRQVVPQGEPGSVDLLQALDEQVQERSLDPSVLAPVARLMSAGQILVQSDLQYERYALPQPQTVARLFSPVPAGLSGPVAFGTPAPTPIIKYPLVDADSLSVPTGTPRPPPLAVYGVPGARPIARAEPARRPLLLAGSGTGILQAASAGLLAGDPTVLYSGSAASDPRAFQQAMAAGADLVLTDSNVKAAQRWGGLADNHGAVEQAAVPVVGPDPSDYRLPLFPGSSTSAQTVASVSGVASVRASGYGNPLGYTPEDQPINAFDHDPSTAWRVGAFSPVDGQSIGVQLTHPVTTDHLTLAQPTDRTVNRFITRVTLRFDGGRATTASLGPTSRSAGGQMVRFAPRTFSHLDIVIDANTRDGTRRYDDLSPVGFSEVTIPGVPAAAESLRLPTDLLTRAGAASAAHRLVVLMARQRAARVPRTDPEASMSRTFTLPTPRAFSVSGTARMAAGDPGALVDRLVGAGGAEVVGGAGVVGASGSSRLGGDLRARASAAVDGDPSTSWSAAIGPQPGQWVQYSLDRPITFGHLALQVVADGRHSVPTRITISTPSGTRTVALPVVGPGVGRAQGAVTSAPVAFPTLAGDQVRITVDAVRPVTTLDYFAEFTGRRDTLPVALAEIGLPGVRPAVGAASSVAAECRGDLLRIDGRPVDIEVTGSTATALDGGTLPIRACGNSAAGVPLAAGTHVVQTSPATTSGWDLDALALGSERGGGPLAGGGAPAGGGPLAVAADGSLPAPAPAPTPTVSVLQQGRTNLSLRVVPDGQPFWLVLGQSLSSGWSATLPGGRSLGPPQLVDGYANGWYLPASALRSPTTIHLTWTPQKVVWAALAVSAGGVVAAAVLALFPPGLAPARPVSPVRPVPDAGRCRRRRRRRRRRTEGSPAGRGAAGRGPSGHGAWTLVPRLVGRADVDRVGVSWRASGAAAVVTGGVAALIARPLTGVVVAAGALGALRLGRGRRVLTGGAVGAVIVTGGYVVVQQYRHRYWPTIDWPSDVSLANALAWLAVCLLAADAVVELVRHWRRGRRG